MLARGYFMNNTKRTSKLFVIMILSILALASVNLSFMMKSNVEAITEDSQLSIESTEHKLRLIELSHFNKPIYINYSEIDVLVRLESPEVDLADVHLHYSQDLINWSTVELTKTEELTDNSSLYGTTFGPFQNVGNYYVLINATRGISQLLDTLNFIITVEDVTEVMFVDFAYKITELENGSQILNAQISVLGENINSNTVEIIFDQPEETNTSKIMEAISGSNYRYNITIYQIEEWQELVKVTFKANTTTGTQYINDDYYFTKAKPRFPENFLTSRLPAILAGLGAVAAMATIFILAKRKPPKKFDFDDEEIKGKKKKKKQKKEETKEKAEEKN